MLGSLFKIKPLIIIRDGVVAELGKERSRRRGIERLENEAREFAPFEEIAVMYSTTPEDAEAVAEDLGDLLPGGTKPIIARFGPVIGTYAGPGVVGLGLLSFGGA